MREQRKGEDENTKLPSFKFEMVIMPSFLFKILEIIFILITFIYCDVYCIIITFPSYDYAFLKIPANFSSFKKMSLTILLPLCNNLISSFFLCIPLLASFLFLSQPI